MGRSQANVQFSIFEGLRGLSSAAKLLYFRVLVEETVNQAGVGAMRLSLWARDLEFDIEETEKALHELDASRYVFCDHDTEQILVRTLIRNDGVADVPNVLWAACRAALQLRSPRLRRELAAELRKLPPRPPDKVNEKTGRVYRYPDPHATAAAIDPDPPSGGDGEPSRPRSDPASHPDPIPDPIETTHGDPIAIPSAVTPFEMGSGMGSRTPGGGGGGGGGGKKSSSVATPVTNAAAARANTRTRRHRGEAPPATELARTAHSPTGYRLVANWAARNPGVRTGNRRDLGRAVDELLAQGADPTLIPDALDRAHDPRWRNPVKALPHAYDDARRAAHPPPAAAQPTNRTDLKIAALLAQDTSDPPARPLRAIGGGPC